ncbi:MAG: hypothetical protein AB1487_07980 [Thermodesulfobacteriota bacterium]
MTRYLFLIGLAIIFSTLATVGCATAPGRLEADYGTSFNFSKFNQILDPEAGEKLPPASGLDGEAARAAMEKYHKSFQEKAAKPAFTISIGEK